MTDYQCWECSQPAVLLNILQYDENPNRKYHVHFCDNKACQDEFFKRNPTAKTIVSKPVEEK
jgi:NADH:ubiquinone oxidoreductase subunit E